MVEELRPTPEQDEAIALFALRESLKINAFAGAGKTSTLKLVASSTQRRGQYIAFNRSIVKEARQSFPKNVECNTGHGLAFNAIYPRLKGDTNKLTDSVTVPALAKMLELRPLGLGEYVLHPRSQAFLIKDSLKRFCYSSDSEPSPTHVEAHGVLAAAPVSITKEVIKFVADHARTLWGRMTDLSDPIPLGHDGYLKCWALSRPTIDADFILLDEAQDSNPVLLQILGEQCAQVVYVGDKYQQIYEWRGAVNAMDRIATANDSHLTLSFRFGEAIAAVANQVLSDLGESRQIIGNPAVMSRLSCLVPEAILARTNSEVIAATIDALQSGKRPHLVGGISDLMNLLDGVVDLKAGRMSSVSEFLGFSRWQDVKAFVRAKEGRHLFSFVGLIETHGEKRLMDALRRTFNEDNCDVTISTAHKAKGREWRSVQLAGDFNIVLGTRKRKSHRSNGRSIDVAELRLVYVALTRAKYELDMSSIIVTKTQSKETRRIFESGIAANRQTFGEADRIASGPILSFTKDMTDANSPSTTQVTSERSLTSRSRKENDSKHSRFWLTFLRK